MKKVKTCNFDEVQRKKKNVFQMNWIWLFPQDTEEYEEEKFHIQSGCSFDEDFFKDIEEEMVTKVSYDIKITQNTFYTLAARVTTVEQTLP